MTLAGVIDDQVFRNYRALLDAEDEAFDELEHAYEDGDRDHFEEDFSAWRKALGRKLAYLSRLGVDLAEVT
ncbi:MAG: hypothetical protein M0008_08220 [Actinomycetota bacterium]|nr:hypothetical protein [Actinomycetota bacterium]